MNGGFILPTAAGGSRPPPSPSVLSLLWGERSFAAQEDRVSALTDTLSAGFAAVARPLADAVSACVSAGEGSHDVAVLQPATPARSAEQEAADTEAAACAAAEERNRRAREAAEQQRGPGGTSAAHSVAHVPLDLQLRILKLSPDASALQRAAVVCAAWRDALAEPDGAVWRAFHLERSRWRAPGWPLAPRPDDDAGVDWRDAVLGKHRVCRAHAAAAVAAGRDIFVSPSSGLLCDALLTADAEVQLSAGASDPAGEMVSLACAALLGCPRVTGESAICFPVEIANSRVVGLRFDAPVRVTGDATFVDCHFISGADVQKAATPRFISCHFEAAMSRNAVRGQSKATFDSCLWSWRENPLWASSSRHGREEDSSLLFVAGFARCKLQNCELRGGSQVTACVVALNDSLLSMSETVVTGASMQGVACLGSSSVCLESQSRVHGNRGNGVIAGEHSKLHLDETDVCSNDQGGIDVVGSAQLESTKSAICDNETYGVRLHQRSTASLFSSNMNGNGTVGIEVTGSSYARLVSCTISNNVHHGVDVRDDADADVTHGTISSNGGFGVSVTGDGHATVVGNHLAQNARAVVVTSSRGAHGDNVP